METDIFELHSKATGGKVFQHVVLPAPMGRAPLTFLPSDSKAPHSLTWVLADFHSIVPGLPFSAILFPVQNRKSWPQLFPALWTKELLQAQTYTHTQQYTHILFLRVSPQPELRKPLSDVKMTPRDDEMKPKARLLSFSRQKTCLYVSCTCAKVFLKGYCSMQVILYKCEKYLNLWLYKRTNVT